MMLFLMLLRCYDIFVKERIKLLVLLLAHFRADTSCACDVCSKNAANMCLADKFYCVITSGLYYISCLSCIVYIVGNSICGRLFSIFVISADSLIEEKFLICPLIYL